MVGRGPLGLAGLTAQLWIWFFGGVFVGLFIAFVWAVIRLLCGLPVGVGGGRGRPRGLRAAEIEAIPVYLYTFGDMGVGETVGSAGPVGEGPRRGEDRDCPVCLSDFVEGDELCLLPCGHSYHKDCVRPWLLKVSTCPKCMSRVVVEVPK